MRLQRSPSALTVTAVALLVCLPPAMAQSTRMAVLPKGGDERTGHYDVLENWMKPAANHDAEWTWGRVAGVAVDNPNRIIVLTRGDLPVDFDKYNPDTSWREAARRGNFLVVLDRNGNVVENWSQWDSKFDEPHQVFISPYDPERKIWVVDNSLGKILVFSNDGKQLVMEIGNPQEDPTLRDRYTFGGQSDMAFLPDGSFLVTDGYGGTRVVKFNARGEYLLEWGEPGTGPGQFDLLHAIVIDADRRVYIADRRNSRIQVFTEDGEFIEAWPDIFDPVDMFVTEDQSIWVMDGSVHRLLKYDRSGQLQYHWGTYSAWRVGAAGRGAWPGAMLLPHQIDVDQDGTLYVANYNAGRVDKFVPKPNANPAKLVGRPLNLVRGPIASPPIVVGSMAVWAKGGDERTGHYDAAAGWLKPGVHDEGWALGKVSGVAVDNPDRVFLVTRGDLPIDFDKDNPDTNFREVAKLQNILVVADREGNIVESWSQWNETMGPEVHGVYVNAYDPERKVWVIAKDPIGAIQVFANDGSRLVMELRHEAGSPQDMALVPDGVYVAYSTRVVKFNNAGQAVLEWGEEGSAPGQFGGLHGIEIGQGGRVYVADRENYRVQIFSSDGEFIEEWPDIFDPSDFFITQDNSVWVVDASLNRLLKYNQRGELVYHWGTYDEAGGIGRVWHGGLSLSHRIAVDEDGTLYIANYNGRTVDRYTPKAGADPRKLVGQPLLLRRPTT